MKFFLALTLAVVVFFARSYAQEAPKARQAIFVRAGDKVLVFRVPPGTARAEPQIEYVGSHFETRLTYYGDQPIFENISVPEYRNMGDKLTLSIGEQERVFTRSQWRSVNLLDKEGYKLLQARIDAENAANDFGLRKYELKQKLLDSLLEEPKVTETKKLNLVLEVVPES